MKQAIVTVVALLLALVLAFLIAVYGFGFLQRETADFRGETEQIENTQADGDYRMAAYNHFYDMCAGVQSTESKISNMEDELEVTESEQRTTVLTTSITAAKNKRAELIAEYNADARKEATAGQFKASDLPYELNENEEETICEAP